MAALSWPIGAALAGLLTLAMVGIWWFATALHHRWDARILAAPFESRPPLKIGSMQVLGTGWLEAVLRLANNAGYFTIRLLVLILWLFGVVLVLPVWDQLPQSLYTFTVTTSRSMGASFVSYLPNLGRIVFILIVTRIVLGMLKWLFDGLRRGHIRLQKFDRSWARQTHALTRFAVIVLAAILIFPLLPGSGTAGFQGIAIFIGALVSIGASTAVGNAVAGVVLTYTKAFQTGDRVRIHDTVGDVTARATFVTRIRTIKNEEIAIPNQLVLAGPIINYSRDAGGNGVAVEIRIGLGYDVPWREAHRLLKEGAGVEGVLQEPEARVYQEELGDFAVAYTLHAFVEDPKKMLGVRSRIIERVMDLFGEAKIEIVSPDHVAWRGGAPVLPGQSVAGVADQTTTSDVPDDPTLPPPEADGVSDEPDGPDNDAAMDEPQADEPAMDDAVDGDGDAGDEQGATA